MARKKKRPYTKRVLGPPLRLTAIRHMTASEAGVPVPKANSVFDNFNASIEHSIHAVQDLTSRVHSLADQACGPIPLDNNKTADYPPSTEGALTGLERAIMSLTEAVSRLDHG